MKKVLDHTSHLKKKNSDISEILEMHWTTYWTLLLSLSKHILYVKQTIAHQLLSLVSKGFEEAWD